jgi:hypothetical protein
MRNVVEDGDGRARVIRPEAVRVSAGGDGRVLAAERRGALVWLRVRTADGRELEAATTESGHPLAGDAVSVEIDPGGVVPLAGAGA